MHSSHGAAGTRRVLCPGFFGPSAGEGVGHQPHSAPSKSTVGQRGGAGGKQGLGARAWEYGGFGAEDSTRLQPQTICR